MTDSGARHGREHEDGVARHRCSPTEPSSPPTAARLLPTVATVPQSESVPLDGFRRARNCAVSATTLSTLGLCRSLVRVGETVRREAAFEELFDTEFDRCVRVARRIVGREDVARDLAAEAFARAWASWRALRHQRPGAWVVRVSVNLAIDTTRKRLPSLAATEADESPQDSAIVRLALAEALSHLSTKQRAAIALRYLDDCSEAEVATALGISNGSVKTHVRRGLAALREVLDPDTLEFVGHAGG